ncbi:MAG TPA: hypothetical protein VF516_06095 [Kofleriaceae bacterium]
MSYVVVKAHDGVNDEVHLEVGDPDRPLDRHISSAGRRLQDRPGVERPVTAL